MENVKDKKVMEIEVGRISVSTDNPRKGLDKLKLEELAASIKEKGLIEPIIVQPKGTGFEIICGERRLKACLLVGEKTITSVIRIGLSDKEAAEIRTIENLQREDLGPIDEANSFQSLLTEHGNTFEDLASRIGKSKTYIKDRLSLISLPKIVKAAIIDGTISPGHGTVIMRIGDKDRERFFKMIVRDKLSIRSAENEIAQFSRDLGSAQFNKKECVTCIHNGKAQAGLFDKDTKLKGKCLKAGCFAKKSNDWVKSEIIELTKDNRKMMSEKEMNSLPGYPTSLSDGSWSKEKLGKKYNERCADCPSLIFSISERDDGNKIEKHCSDNKCFNKLAYGDQLKGSPTISKNETQKRKTDGQTRDAKVRFWKSESIENATPDVISATCLFVLSEFCFRYVDTGKKKRAKDFLAMTNAQRGKALEALFKSIVNGSVEMRDEDLEAVAAKLGRITGKHFIIDEAYLKPKTKDQIISLSKELKIYSGTKKLGEMKKPELIKWFLSNKLKGKIPKEMKLK